MKLVIVCVECGRVEHVPCSDDKMLIILNVKQLFSEFGWFFSLVDPKERLVAPLCPVCALNVASPELLEAATRELSGKGSTN